MSTFNYLERPALLENLKRGLSTNRIARYQVLAGDDALAMQLYAWNTGLSAALYGPLQALEVLTRNRIHDALTVRFADASWFDLAGLLAAVQLRKLEEAKDKLNDARKTISPPGVVSELSFGFWTGLLARQYDQSLWKDQKLWKLFQSRIGKNSRTDVFDGYDKLRRLRNRIAHHECILAQDLPATYALVLDLTKTLCPDTAAWAQHHSWFDAAWNDAANPWVKSNS